MEYPLLKQLRDELDSILKNKDAEQQELPENFKCASCGKNVAKVVVDFCKDHPEWYDDIYCRKCQSEHKKEGG